MGGCIPRNKTTARVFIKGVMTCTESDYLRIITTSGMDIILHKSNSRFSKIFELLVDCRDNKKMAELICTGYFDLYIESAKEYSIISAKTGTFLYAIFITSTDDFHVIFKDITGSFLINAEIYEKDPMIEGKKYEFTTEPTQDSEYRILTYHEIKNDGITTVYEETDKYVSLQS